MEVENARSRCWPPGLAFDEVAAMQGVSALVVQLEVVAFVKPRDGIIGTPEAKKTCA
jgi:hypothetical protein